MAKTTFDAGFGHLAQDQRGGVLQTATKFATQDASGTPKTSPLAYSSSVIALTVPDAAVQLVLCPTTDLLVSEDAAVARYDVIAAGTKEALPVALMQTVYIRRDTADGTVRFRFAEV